MNAQPQRELPTAVKILIIVAPIVGMGAGLVFGILADNPGLGVALGASLAGGLLALSADKAQTTFDTSVFVVLIAIGLMLMGVIWVLYFFAR